MSITLDGSVRKFLGEALNKQLTDNEWAQYRQVIRMLRDGYSFYKDVDGKRNINNMPTRIEMTSMLSIISYLSTTSLDGVLEMLTDK